MRIEEYQKMKQALFELTPIPDPDWNEFVTRLALKKFTKGDHLIAEGQVESHIYFLNKGATRNYFIRSDRTFTKLAQSTLKLSLSCPCA